MDKKDYILNANVNATMYNHWQTR